MSRGMSDRRRLLLAGLAAGILPHAARAQGEWPTRPITMVTGYAPGGVTDLATRAIAERMQREIGQSIVVDPKPGGATSVSATQVAQSRPDGYTLLMGTTSLAINPALQPALTPRDPRRELAPVGMAYRTPFVLHLHPEVPARSTAELIAYAKANPGRLNFGSSGTGAVNHLCLEMFRREAGIDVVHIPYRGGAPAMQALLSGEVGAYFGNPSDIIPHLGGDRVRVLGIAGPDRLPSLPGVPTIAEQGYPGFRAETWNGIAAPANTPQPVIRRMAEALGQACGDAHFRAALERLGTTPVCSTPEAFRQAMDADAPLWREAVRISGATLN